MPGAEASAVLYAVDLDELRQWVGCKDERRFREAWKHADITLTASCF